MIYWAGGNAYTLAFDHKNGWNAEAFRERYSEVLERYDYVVGDWGYNQLRLKGFYRDQQHKAPKESVISGLVDYINEYCNFGCAYFVLEKADPATIPEGAAEAAAVQAEEANESAAETAAAFATGEMILRWPLKERPGAGRVPGTSPSAVARAISENAERRAAAAQMTAAQTAAAGTSAAAREEMYGRGGAYEQGNRTRHPSGDGSFGRDRRPEGGGFKGAQTGGQERRHGGGHKPQQDQQRTSRKDGGERPGAHDSSRGNGGFGNFGPGGQSRDGAGRWPGKNRRRPSQTGKPPNRPRPEGAPRSEGSGGRPDKGRQTGIDRP